MSFTVECPRNLVPEDMRLIGMREAWNGVRKKHSPEQIVSQLRQVDLAAAILLRSFHSW
jgi:hypothetical protein